MLYVHIWWSIKWHCCLGRHLQQFLFLCSSALRLRYAYWFNKSNYTKPRITLSPSLWSSHASCNEYIMHTFLRFHTAHLGLCEPFLAAWFTTHTVYTFCLRNRRLASKSVRRVPERDMNALRAAEDGRRELRRPFVAQSHCLAESHFLLETANGVTMHRTCPSMADHFKWLICNANCLILF